MTAYDILKGELGFSKVFLPALKPDLEPFVNLNATQVLNELSDRVLLAIALEMKTNLVNGNWTQFQIASKSILVKIIRVVNLENVFLSMI